MKIHFLTALKLEKSQIFYIASEASFEVHAVADFRTGGMSESDSPDGEVHGDADRLGDAVAGEGGTDNSAAEYITGAVIAALYRGAEDVVYLAGGAVVGSGSQMSQIILQPGAGEDDAGLFREDGKPGENVVYIFAAVAVASVFAEIFNSAVFKEHV